MKFQFIDCIRGIAILMVILVHTGQYIQNLNGKIEFLTMYSQMGVQLFFVASAYTLCLSSQNRIREQSPMLNYGIRRIFRIAPIYWLGIILYFYIASLNIFSKNQLNIDNYTSKNIFSNFFFIHSFFESANNTIVPGGWSIATEMFFYLLFPVTFKIAQSYITTKSKIFYFILLGITISQVCVATLINFGFNLSNNTFLYYSIANQLPCFIIGIGYFYFTKLNTKKLNNVSITIGFLTFSIFSVFFWKLYIDYLFSWIPIFSSLSFIFLIEFFRNNKRINFFMLSEIGKVSFSMYLFHFIFIYTITLLPTKYTNKGILSLIFFYIIITIITYIVGKISYVLIEKPFIKIGKKVIEKLGNKLAVISQEN